MEDVSGGRRFRLAGEAIEGALGKQQISTRGCQLGVVQQRIFDFMLFVSWQFVVDVAK